MIKNAIKKTKMFRNASEKGLLSKTALKCRIVNFIFQRIFRINSDSHWSVHYTSVVIAPENIELGAGSERNFMRSPGCYIQAINGIQIGANVWWGPNVGIISANHDTTGDMASHKKSAGIVIGDDVWIGMNAVILPGVQLGDNVVVGAGAIVTKSFPEGVVIAGNPAQVIKKRTE